MEYLSLIGTVTVLNILAAMSPGPDFVVVVRNSLCYSRRSGVYTSLGISVGLLVHLFYCVAGIGLIISKSVVLFSIIKVLGAGYLIYLGTSSILSRNSKLNLKEMVTGTDLEPFQAFKAGFLTNVLNPKVTLFMLSMFTFVIGKDTPLYVILIISVIILLTALIWFSIVSTFFTQKNVQKAFFKYEYIINSFLGLILIFLGVKVALTFLPL